MTNRKKHNKAPQPRSHWLRQGLSKGVSSLGRMISSRRTLIRYGAVVAAIYFVAFLILALCAGIAAGPVSEMPMRLWMLPFAMAACSVFMTTAAIARFGHVGGSVYAAPTAMHIVLLICLVLAIFHVL